MRVLVLGGTAEARELAARLVDAEIDVTTSLAGRVHRPRLPRGSVRVGGFGGVEGLRRYLRDGSVTAVVDATHPFAEQMTAHAATACADERVPLLRLERPGWTTAPGAQRWHWVADLDAAAQAVTGSGARPFLTVGRQALDRFTGPLAGREALVRVVDAPAVPLPSTWTLRLSRGPYHYDEEVALMRDHRVGVLVTKDSGGGYTWPKMQAAATLGVPVVVVARQSPPSDVMTVSVPSAAFAWVAARR